MNDDAIRIAVGLRVGAPISQPHQCVQCGMEVDEFARHHLIVDLAREGFHAAMQLKASSITPSLLQNYHE